jgi:chitodextrinase
MSARRIVSAASILLLAIIFVPEAGAAARDRKPPTAPSNLRIIGSTSTSVTLAWDPASDNSGSFSYIVRENAGVRFTLPQTQTTFTRSKLWPEKTNTYSVVAVDKAGNQSGSSNTVSYTTPPDTTPPSAPELSSTLVSATRVSLEWTTSTDDVSQVFYTLLRDGTPVFSDLIGARSWTVLDLAPATTYTFRISVRDWFGNRSESNSVTVTTLAASDVTPPSPPSNLTGFDAGSCEGWLRWDASTDDSDPQSAILYRVFVNGRHRPESDVLGGTSTVAYGDAAGNNTFVVRAVDSSGNVSGPSNELTLNLSC